MDLKAEINASTPYAIINRSVIRSSGLIDDVNDPSQLSLYCALADEVDGVLFLGERIGSPRFYQYIHAKTPSRYAVPPIEMPAKVVNYQAVYCSAKGLLITGVNPHIRPSLVEQGIFYQERGINIEDVKSRYQSQTALAQRMTEIIERIKPDSITTALQHAGIFSLIDVAKMGFDSQACVSLMTSPDEFKSKLKGNHGNPNPQEPTLASQIDALVNIDGSHSKVELAVNGKPFMAAGWRQEPNSAQINLVTKTRLLTKPETMYALSTIDVSDLQAKIIRQSPYQPNQATINFLGRAFTTTAEQRIAGHVKHLDETVKTVGAYQRVEILNPSGRLTIGVAWRSPEDPDTVKFSFEARPNVYQLATASLKREKDDQFKFEGIFTPSLELRKFFDDNPISEAEKLKMLPVSMQVAPSISNLGTVSKLEIVLDGKLTQAVGWRIEKDSPKIEFTAKIKGQFCLYSIDSSNDDNDLISHGPFEPSPEVLNTYNKLYNPKPTMSSTEPPPPQMDMFGQSNGAESQRLQADLFGSNSQAQQEPPPRITNEQRNDIKKRLKTLIGNLDTKIPKGEAQQLTRYHIEKGNRSFVKLTNALVKDLGKDAIPYICDWYDLARERLGEFSGGMTSKTDVDLLRKHMTGVSTPPAAYKAEMDINAVVLKEISPIVDTVDDVEPISEQQTAPGNQYALTRQQKTDMKKLVDIAEVLIDTKKALIIDQSASIMWRYLSQLLESGRIDQDKTPYAERIDTLNDIISELTALKPSLNIKETAGLDSDTNERGNTHEQERLRDSGERALEDISPPHVPTTGIEQRTGPRHPTSSDEDRHRDEDVRQARVLETGRVGHGEDKLYTPATGDKGTGRRGPNNNESPGDDGTDNTTSRTRRLNHYQITERDDFEKGGQKTKFKQNVEAIQLLKKLSEESRQASPEEQSVLVKYAGWGGLKQAFRTQTGHMTEGWQNEVETLEGLLNDAQLTAARRSVLDSFYTGQKPLTAVYAALEKMGFTGGNILEPSAGTGNFLGTMPEAISQSSNVTAVELDALSGDIAKQLYPNSTIYSGRGFETIQLNDDAFDLAIGNVPFGDFKVYDDEVPELSKFMVHDYFFAKSVNKLRGGGLLAMIISTGFMDKKNSSARQYISEHANLVGAIRLPNDAFKKNANTEVTTDLIFLQKKSAAEEQVTHQWLDTGAINDPNGGDDITINQYFADNPHMMLGSMQRTGTMYRGDMPTLVADDNTALEDALTRAVDQLPSNIFTPLKQLRQTQPTNTIFESSSAAEQYQLGSFFIEDGRLKKRGPDNNKGATGQVIDATTPYSNKRNYGLNSVSRIKLYVGVKDALRNLINTESDDRSLIEIKRSRDQLNTRYDRYYAKYGPLNSGALYMLRTDPDWPLVASIEQKIVKAISKKKAQSLGIEPVKASAQKGAIFTRRTIQPYRKVSHAESPADALNVSLAEYGRINLQYMNQITDIPVDDIIKELTVESHVPLIFNDPLNSQWVTADEYLSGNVKEKLKLALKLSRSDPSLVINIDALKAIQPEDVEAVDISIKMGAGWVPESIYKDFLEHLLGDSVNTTIKYIPHTGSWVLKIRDASGVQNTSTWGTEKLPAVKIIKKIMNGNSVKVFHHHQDGTRTLNIEATQLALSKVESIKTEFNDWLLTDKTRRESIESIYNELFNTHVNREFNGEHLILPGKVPDEIINLRATQKRGAWRMMQSPTTLLDHVVGAGKTFSGVAAMMEMKRLGIAKKPMVVVPNHLIEQWQRDWYTLYPAANILALTKNDFSKSNRQLFLSKIATGDWDAVIIAHSSFGFIPVSPEQEKYFLKSYVNDLILSIELAKEADGQKGSTVRQLENRKIKLEGKIKELQEKPRDNLLHFDELGVDQLFVDESHLLGKNLFIATSMERVPGIGTTEGSKKAFDLYMKTQHLLQKNNGRGVIFATGTPITNSMAELFTIQRFLGPEFLQEKGIEAFDSWIKIYGDITTKMELDSTATKYKSTTRLRQFTNVAELSTAYHVFADTITLQDLKDSYKTEIEKHNSLNPDDIRDPRFPVPEVFSGKRINVIIPRNRYQANYIDDIVERATDIENRMVEPHQDNMLKVTMDARKAGLDMRIIDPGVPHDPNGKLAVVVDNVTKHYRQWASDKGTQLIFCDLSVPNRAKEREAAKIQNLLDLAERGEPKAIEMINKLSPDDRAIFDGGVNSFSVYDEIKRLLITDGMPEKEIAFIHDYNTDKQKSDLFEEVNAGKIRVLLGSRAKMGAGTNVQERLVAIHSIDAPWTPDKVEQSEGRGIRQGNSLYNRDPDNFRMALYAYATEKTYDARMWQVLETKSTSLERFRSGSCGRDMGDIGGEAASAAEMKAAASGNPLILEEIELKTEIAKLELEKKSFNRNSHKAQAELDKIQTILERTPSYLVALNNDDETAQKARSLLSASKDKFIIQVYGKQYNQRDVADRPLKQIVNRLLLDEVVENEVKFLGFNWRLEFNQNRKMLMASALGETEHTSTSDFAFSDRKFDKNSLLRVMRKAINDISYNQSKAIEKLAYAKRELPKVERVAVKPFTKDEELATLKVRYHEVVALLTAPEDDADKQTLDDVNKKPTKPEYVETDVPDSKQEQPGSKASPPVTNNNQPMVARLSM